VIYCSIEVAVKLTEITMMRTYNTVDTMLMIHLPGHTILILSIVH